MIRYLISFSCACTALAWLLPNKYPPWTSFYNDFSMFMALWSALVAALMLSGRNVSLPKWSVGCFVLAIVPVAQVVLGLVAFAGDGWVAAGYLLGFSSASCLAALWRADQRPALLTTFSAILIMASLVSIFIALCQWMQVNEFGIFATDLSSGRYPYANLAQPNNLATLLCLGLAAALYLTQSGRISRIAGAFFCGVLIFGITITSSRTPLLIAGFLCFWTLWKFRWGRSAAWTASSLTAGLALFGYLFFYGISQFGELMLLTDPSQGLLTLDRPRLIIWQQAFNAILQQPWCGYGWNQVSTAQVMLATDHVSHIVFGSSHNVLLDLLIWNGAPMGLLIIALGTYWLISRAMRCSTPESWHALLCIGIVLIHGLLELPLEYAYFLLPLGFFCGLVEMEHPRTPDIRIQRRQLWLPIALSAGLLAWVWVEYRIIEEDYRLMRFETLRIGTIKSQQSAPNIILLNQLREDIRFIRLEIHSNMTPDALKSMGMVVHRFPYYASLYKYTLALALNRQYGPATLELRRLCNMYPPEQCPIAVAEIKRLANEKYPQLREWKLSVP